VSGHGADNARIVPIAAQAWIGRMAIGQQRGSRLHIALTKAAIDPAELSAIMARHRRPRTEIFGVLAARFGFIAGAINGRSRGASGSQIQRSVVGATNGSLMNPLCITIGKRWFYPLRTGRLGFT
jgi:hypothetical protein